MAAVQGIDISAVQGPNVPWKKLVAAEIDYAFLRCHVGNNGRDALFAKYVAAGSDEGILLAPYFFPFPLPHLTPENQADLFIASAVVNGAPLGSRKGELPPAFDLEWPPPEEWKKWGCTADQIVDWAIACLDRLEVAYGRAPIIYSYPWFLKSISTAKNFTLLMRYKLWIAGGAQYLNGDGHVPDLTKEQPPAVNGWGHDWLFWQHDGNGGKRLPGTGIDADFDVFRYDLATLRTYADIREDEIVADTLPEMARLAHAMSSTLIVEDAVHAYRQERAQRMLEAA